MRKLLTVLFMVVPMVYDQPARAQKLYDQPVLIVDPDMHAGRIKTVAIAESGKFAVTGSYDKTVRIWTLGSGELKNTLRMPAGPGYVGKVFAVAISPHSDLVAVGGWMSGDGDPESVYLFDPASLTIVTQIGELPDVVNKLMFSKDGRYLAVAVSTGGLRIYDRERQWKQVFVDDKYGKHIYGLSFALDGRLATASYDRKIRLYGPGPDFEVVVPPKDVSADPFEVAFRPDGEVLAVGYSGGATVDFLDGHDLHTLPGPKTAGLNEKLKLGVVAWARDGSKLFVGGGSKLYAWDNAGLGERRTLPGGDDTIMSICASDDDGILIAAAGPLLKYMDNDGTLRWQKITPIARLGSESGTLSVSRDGSVVDFGEGDRGRPGIRFNMKTLTLTRAPPADGLTAPPMTEGLPIKDWRNNLHPKFDGKEMKLEDSEESRSLAISPTGQRFVFGTTWALRARDANNQPIWRRDMGDVWALNISGDARWVVAAYDDGTIRWHRLDNGQEMLALMVLYNKEGDYEWVAWTPEGFYYAQGAAGVLQWHANNTESAGHAFANAFPAAIIEGHSRPDVLPRVLDTMDVSQALDLARLEAGKEAVRKATGMPKRPGHRLHVLAIGINYPNWASLKLVYPEKDASGLIGKLKATHGDKSGLYGEIKYVYLNSASATRSGIITMLEGLQDDMHADDVAVVMFSGHGTIQGNGFQLLASDVNVLTRAGVKVAQLSASELKGYISPLAQKGRVLLLLDACHSGKISENEPLAPDAEVLRNQLALPNATILTSSAGTEVSLENVDWGHGAFTKVLLDALSGADKNNDGRISVGELVEYLGAHLGPLTKGAQTLGSSNNATGDIFVAGR
jgi:WD40 repeat protein